MIFECPGLGKLKFPYPEITACPGCGAEVEIWSDEFEAKCPGCGLLNSKKAGQCCIDWCEKAALCIGRQRYEEYMKNKQTKKGA